MIEGIRKLFQPKPAARVAALALDGGGARAAYQSGVLKFMAENFPEGRFPILTGVSAGAINTAHLANHSGSFRESTHQLAANWLGLKREDVYKSESNLTLLWNLWRGRQRQGPEHQFRGLVDTSPLRDYLRTKMNTRDGELHGIGANLQKDRLQAVALTTTNYATGQSATWVQGQNISNWERPDRVGIQTRLNIDHIMASTALPLLFPAVRIGSAWYGDGGVRLANPLSPAIHLGATHILVISTRYHRSRAEADRPEVVGYPSAARIIGLLMSAIFLDALDQDAHTLQRINRLVCRLPERKRIGLQPIHLLMLRPSMDIARLAGDYEARLPAALSLFARLLGTGESRSPEWLSMLLFEEEYISRLLEVGYEDARRQNSRIAEFFERSGCDSGTGSLLAMGRSS